MGYWFSRAVFTFEKPIAHSPMTLPKFFALVTWGLAIAPAAQAGGTLRCVSLEYPPLIFTGSAGTPQGIAVDVVNETMALAGWKVELEILPWGRALDLMQRGQRDCIFTIFKTPEREQFLDFSTKALLQQPIALYARKNSGIRYNGDFAKLRSKSFLVVHAVNYGNKFESAKAGLRTIQAYSAAQTFEKLERGQGDLTISNVYLAAYQLAAAGPDLARNIVQLQPTVETVTSYIAFAKGKHPQALRAFDAHIDQVVYGNQRAHFARILDRHQVPEVQRASLLLR